MLRGAYMARVLRGKPLYEAYGPPRLTLIHTGQARVKALSRDGRSVTVRYAGAGQLIGLPSVVIGSAPISAETVVDCEVAVFNPQLVQALARKNAELAWLFAEELAEIAHESQDLLRRNLFDSVQERVARHLLALASPGPGGMVVRVDQSAIANSVGSVREVIARTLRKFRAEGCIEKIGNGILITSPAKLQAIAAGSYEITSTSEPLPLHELRTTPASSAS